jgi:antagonist of KipI
MSIKVIKAGLATQLVTKANHKFLDMGVGCHGYADELAARMAHSLVGNSMEQYLLEFAFPAPTLEFMDDCFIAITGANFTAKLNNEYLKNHSSQKVAKGSIVHFERPMEGKYGYLSVAGGFSPKHTELVLLSDVKKRSIQMNDILTFLPQSATKNKQKSIDQSFIRQLYTADNDSIRCILGPESFLLTDLEKSTLETSTFYKEKENRMASYVSSDITWSTNNFSMTSSGVSFGTIQLLPNGQLCVLLSERQTVGGYPRIVQIAAIDIPKFVQWPLTKPFKLKLINIEEAISELHHFETVLNTYFP